MKINILRNTIPWFGKHSGYEVMTEFLPNHVSVKIIEPKEHIVSMVIGKMVKIYRGWNRLRPSEIFAGLRFAGNIGKNDISHILYLEKHLHILSINKKNQHKIVGTIHLPISQWNRNALSELSKLGRVFILYEAEMVEFSKYIDLRRLHFIRHGVNIDFFKPGQKALVKKNRILFVGHYLRNFEMFLAVYELIRKDIGDVVEFHFIIPSCNRKIPAIQRILELRNVSFHEGLSDEQLLEFYQTSYLMLMPMNDSGANTAMVQALATGLPIITTDVGGIRSYGGGDIFPLVENNANEAMADLFRKYYHDMEYRNVISENIRRYAIRELDWNLIARQHIKVYESILEN